jgi:hypothetical protein
VAAGVGVSLCGSKSFFLRHRVIPTRSSAAIAQAINKPLFDLIKSTTEVEDPSGSPEDVFDGVFVLSDVVGLDGWRFFFDIPSGFVLHRQTRARSASCSLSLSANTLPPQVNAFRLRQEPVLYPPPALLRRQPQPHRVNRFRPLHHDVLKEIAVQRPIRFTQPLTERERIACEFARTVPAISDVPQIIICPQKGFICKAPVNAEPSRLAANHSAQSRRRSRRSD